MSVYHAEVGGTAVMAQGQRDEYGGALRVATLICVGIAVVAAVVAAFLGRPVLSFTFALGMALGLLNTTLLRVAAARTRWSQAGSTAGSFAHRSMVRLSTVTALGLAVVWFFGPTGLGALAGLAVFQVVLVVSAGASLLKRLRSEAISS